MVKIKPLDKKETSKIKTKLILLILLIFLGLIISFFFKNKKPSDSSQKKTKEEVLGEKIEINNNNFDEIFARMEKYRDDLKNQISNQIREVEKLTSESISSLIYDTTIKPIINQIEKLPKDQQERVKKEICQ